MYGVPNKRLCLWYRHDDKTGNNLFRQWRKALLWHGNRQRRNLMAKMAAKSQRNVIYAAVSGGNGNGMERRRNAMPKSKTNKQTARGGDVFWAPN